MREMDETEMLRLVDVIMAVTRNRWRSLLGVGGPRARSSARSEI